MKTTSGVSNWLARFILWNVGAALGTLIFTCMFYVAYMLVTVPETIPVVTFLFVGGYLILTCTMWAIDVVFIRPKILKKFQEIDDDVQGY